jgi:hypothetical protein
MAKETCAIKWRKDKRGFSTRNNLDNEYEHQFDVQNQKEGLTKIRTSVAQKIAEDARKDGERGVYQMMQNREDLQEAPVK